MQQWSQSHCGRGCLVVCFCSFWLGRPGGGGGGGVTERQSSFDVCRTGGGGGGGQSRWTDVSAQEAALTEIGAWTGMPPRSRLHSRYILAVRLRLLHQWCRLKWDRWEDITKSKTKDKTKERDTDTERDWEGPGGGGGGGGGGRTTDRVKGTLTRLRVSQVPTNSVKPTTFAFADWHRIPVFPDAELELFPSLFSGGNVYERVVYQ